MFRQQFQFAIDSQGNIYSCLENMGVSSAKIDDLSTGKMSSIKIAQTTFQDNPFEDPKCLACSYLPICGGGCPIVRHKKQENNMEYCSLYKDNLAELLPYFYNYKQF